ncbi:hypothetical protein [Actinoplanes regularis]|uniref:hypothetical protein n=1 Tax=Actinoplanes regularis TaxID=52697 RepID=UPI0024A25FD5|nr:hypothetical protein [Actinoplanes regularis]GLW30521.1 hypothetical protein Areg01_34610 [Actinoplanes regularis]
MSLQIRRTLLIPLTALVVALASACVGPPETRSDAELLAIGNARLDEIAIPADWVADPPESGRVEGNLRWERDYKAPMAPADAARELDELILSLGWKRTGTCSGTGDIPCWTYDRGGLNLWPTALEGAGCPEGRPVCADVSLWLRANYEAPI